MFCNVHISRYFAAQAAARRAGDAKEVLKPAHEAALEIEAAHKAAWDKFDQSDAHSRTPGARVL